MPKPHIAEKRSQVAFEERRLVHVRLRLKMRYDLDIDLHEMREINRIIASGGGTGRRQEERRALEVWIPLRGTPVCWEYLIPKQCVVTVLPPPPPMPPEMLRLLLKEAATAPDTDRQRLLSELESMKQKLAIASQTAGNGATRAAYADGKVELITREFEAYKLYVKETQDIHASNNRYHRNQMGWVSTILKANYQLIQGDPNWVRAMAILSAGTACPQDQPASQFCTEHEAHYVNEYPPTLVVPEIW